MSNFKGSSSLYLGYATIWDYPGKLIVSAHSKVEGLGELQEVSEFGTNIATGYAVPNIENISIFRRKYISAILRKANGKNFVTDKMPQNFRFVPLICAAFPEAKIIHVRKIQQQRVSQTIGIILLRPHSGTAMILKTLQSITNCMWI